MPIAVLPHIRQWQEETNLAAADNRRVCDACVCGYRYGACVVFWLTGKICCYNSVRCNLLQLCCVGSRQLSMRVC